MTIRALVSADRPVVRIWHPSFRLPEQRQAKASVWSMNAWELP